MAAATVMFVMWRYGMTHPRMQFAVFYPLYLLFLALYMPTMALANTATFALLAQTGRSTVKSFPSIRIWGTVGFVAAMWFVNSAYWSDGALGFTLSESRDPGHLRFQYNAMQLLCSAIMGIITAVYSFTLPSAKPLQEQSEAVARKVRLFDSAKTLLADRRIAVFLVFVIFSGVCLQISNGFATPFITHFTGLPEYADSLAAGNATMLFSLSQISEAACILLVGISLKRKGIRWVYAVGLLAWALRFLMLGTGNPGSGLWLLIGSMLVYGIAFNFITIAGQLHIQQVAPEGMKGFAQGFMMFMNNGIGATFGTIAAGAVVNNWCSWQMVGTAGGQVRLFMGDWTWPWLIFAFYAFALFVAWLVLFKKQKVRIIAILSLMPFILLCSCATHGRSAGSTQADSISASLNYQLSSYPASQYRDVYKNFMQDFFGPGHLLADTAAAGQYLRSELALDCSFDGPLYEPTGYKGNFYRVNLAVIRDGVVPYDTFFKAFVESVQQIVPPSSEEWMRTWSTIDSVISTCGIHFVDEEKDRADLEAQFALGDFVVHHSRRYNDSVNFHYRIISRPIFDTVISPLLDSRN